MTLPEVAPSLLKKAQAASPLKWALDYSHLCCKQTDTSHRSSVAWLYNPCLLKRSHSSGILIFCNGISTSQSRGILIYAMGLLHISLVHSLLPLKRHFYMCRGTTLIISLAHSAPHSRGNTVGCVEPLSFLFCSHC